MAPPPRFENVPFTGHSFQDHVDSRCDRMDSVVAAHQYFHKGRKKFVLCFDGTGNKFSGTDEDSNILKIYRMLDRSDNTQFHYYQPGIGTYVVTKSLSHTSRIDRLRSWYNKAKDSAVGTSFAAHVMGGYKFLMRYYVPGDDIFLFGFSRGAYTARFLAEMLDHVGLLSAGNEEMAQFAWKTFQKWQCRTENNAEEKKEKKALLDFMCAFRETFSRPVRRIRFLGLFDTVNSVPKFENAWMKRSKFPYTARSSAKVIRHAVSIDERRAKFRQDLISERKPNSSHQYKRHQRYRREDDEKAKLEEATRGRQPSMEGLEPPSGRRATLTVPNAVSERYRDQSETSGIRNLSPGLSVTRSNSTSSISSVPAVLHFDDGDSDEENEQDILEVWFAGCHADIGGGWPLGPGEESALAHVPLVWMVREAQRAGLCFDEKKLRDLNCIYVEPPGPAPRRSTASQAPLPIIQVDPTSPCPQDTNFSPVESALHFQSNETDEPSDEREEKSPKPTHHVYHLKSKFHKHLHHAATKGRIHDVLQFRNGASRASVISWNVMEYLPFRRMDLQADGSWKSITWPLPKGEVRDIPDNALIHTSVIRRMNTDPNYRPGNLIVGGGGRGVRKAPAELGIGKWRVHSDPGDPIGETFIRAAPPEIKKSDRSITPIAVSPGGPQGMFIGGG